MSVLPRFRTPAWRPYRALMFVGMGISAVFPVLDGLRMFGIDDMEMQIGLSWLVLQGALYILGAGLYAVSIRFNKHARRPSLIFDRPESQNHGIPASSTSWEVHTRSSTF
jgi:predicted membrane channel-forming protein YqfA (hemolysin III family)